MKISFFILHFDLLHFSVPTNSTLPLVISVGSLDYLLIRLLFRNIALDSLGLAYFSLRTINKYAMMQLNIGSDSCAAASHQGS